MTYLVQMQTVCGCEGGVVEAVASFQAPSLPYAFDRAQEQIAIDFGHELPDAITLIISKVPANGPS